MEKATPLSGNSNVAKLFPFFTKLATGLMGRFVPGSMNSTIDQMLFTPKATDIKTVRLPRGIHQFIMKTSDGDVQAYQTGSGPTVVFVHGWGGGAYQFFPLMRGLSQCGFSAIAFDQLGHGLSGKKPATLQQSIATTNHVFNTVQDSEDGLCATVGHSTGCVTIANARPELIEDMPLFLISPVFNYKLYFLKKLLKLNLRTDLVKQYSNNFAKTYHSEYKKLELARRLAKYADVTVIAHDELDAESAVADSEKFCARHPHTKLLITRSTDHVRIINSETVWQALKSHLDYHDTTVNFTEEMIYQ